MAELETLNAVRHAGLRLSRACDSGRHFAQIVASEFLRAAPHYPILFTKHPETGAFYAGVILGVEPGRSLMAVGGALPDYRPADLERQGFFLGDDGIAVDPGSVAFADRGGQMLFDADGQPTTALKRVQHALHVLTAGISETDAMIQRLLAHRLIEPIDVSLSLDDGSQHMLEGLYTVSLDALHGLADDAVLALFRAGDLQLAYAQAGSVQHLRTLGRRLNDSLLDPR